jgi:tRNA pseudouridine55 synthase
MLSLSSALRDYPACEVSVDGCEKLSHGIPPDLADLADRVNFDEGQKVLLSLKGQALAMARFAPSRIKEKRGDFELLRVYNGGE